MTLLETWREEAYKAQSSQDSYDEFWNAYFEQETGFYKSILTCNEIVKGNVPSLAEKYNVSENIMVGILDGINDSLKNANPIETMDRDTELVLDIDLEKLYKNMVIAKAEWLYTLPEWDSLLSKEKRDELYRDGKKAGTVVKGKKVGRNDPCPCGSGKKYKFCCGKN